MSQNSGGTGQASNLNQTTTTSYHKPASANSQQHHHNNHSHHQKREYCVKVNFIEIYKEELRDLLDTSVQKELQIREDEAGNTRKKMPTPF
jgi:hypothetical protein